MTDSIKRRGFLKKAMIFLGLTAWSYKNIGSESFLFELDDLEDDFSRKKVSIDVEVYKFLLDNYKPNIEYMLNYTRDFYNGINVELNFRFVEKLNHSSLKSAEHLGLVILPEEENNGEGIALLENSLAVISYRNYSGKPAEKGDDYTSSVITHEIGHLFALIHSHRFRDDPVEDYSDGIPNIMSFRRKGKENSINDFQKKIVHSFLSKGKIYRQLEKIDFIFDSRYIGEIAMANNYHPVFQ